MPMLTYLEKILAAGAVIAPHYIDHNSIIDALFTRVFLLLPLFLILSLAYKLFGAGPHPVFKPRLLGTVIINTYTCIYVYIRTYI